MAIARVNEKDGRLETRQCRNRAASAVRSGSLPKYGRKEMGMEAIVLKL
jgi:hypothetical protein